VGRTLKTLNLKNPKVYLLASELARLPGETPTTAVITALEQCLEAERIKRSGRTAKNILAFADRFAAGMSPGSHAANRADLYDDHGLPR